MLERHRLVYYPGMNRREAIRVLAGTAVLLATVPAEATAVEGLKSPQKPDENYYRWYTVKLGIEPGEGESVWVDRLCA